MAKKELTKDEKIALFASMPDQLEQAIKGLSENQLDTARKEGRWTIRQLLHHIVDADDLTRAIIKAAIGNPGCRFNMEWYSPDNSWDETMDYGGRGIEAALHLYRACHQHLEELLAHIPEAWDREVILQGPMAGGEKKLPVSYLVYSQTRHALYHLEQIKKSV